MPLQREEVGHSGLNLWVIGPKAPHLDRLSQILSNFKNIGQGFALWVKNVKISQVFCQTKGLSNTNFPILVGY